MWTQTLSNARWPNRAGREIGTRTVTRSGFTLIELLVVVAIIALLISILLPSLRSARDQAKAVHCGAQMRGFAGSNASYASEFNEWIPGANTSGVELEAVNTNDAEELNNPMLPVQRFDWMTPLIRLETGLPRVRADRFKLLLERFRCAALPRFNAQPHTDTAPVDMQDFLDIPAWPGISYLMPAGFQYWGRGTGDMVLGRKKTGIFNATIRPRTWPDFWSVQVPHNYTARLGTIGVPSGKVMAADGTRFLDDTGLVDFDAHPSPGHFGAFTTSGAWWGGSTAYGVAGNSSNWDGDPVMQGSPSQGDNLPLTYRHSARGRGNGAAGGHKGSIDLLFFDGHVDRVQDKESRNINLWYPKGSKVKQGQEKGMTTVRPDYVVR